MNARGATVTGNINK